MATLDEKRRLNAETDRIFDEAQRQTKAALDPYTPYGGYTHPEGYNVGPNGVYFVPPAKSNAKIQPAPELVALRPIAVAGRQVDEQGRYRLRIAWHDDAGKWRSETFPRDTVMAARKIIDLAALGAPVTSGSASRLVTYLAAAEKTNAATLPTEKVTTHLGWVDDRTFVHADGHPMTVVPIEGADDYVAAFTTRGTLEAWKFATAGLGDAPYAQLGIFGALTPPLLAELRIGSFTLDLAGLTTTGKTSTLRLAASCWGDPTDHGLILPWNATKVAIERYASLLRGLPLLLDDTKTARSPQIVDEIVYEISQGQTGGRGAADGGVEARRKWQVVLISTGEQPLLTFKKSGGAVARVVPTWSAPFPEGSAERVSTLIAGITDNYGHAGPLFVARLRDERQDLRGRHRELASALSRDIGAVAARRADPVAALQLAAELAQRYGLVRTVPDCAFWRGLVLGGGAGEADDTDRPLQALEAALNWAIAHVSRFDGARLGMVHAEPLQGWAGAWRDGYIAFDPAILREVLKRDEFDYGGVVEAWRARGWTACRTDKYTTRVKLNNCNASLVKIRLDKIPISIAETTTPLVTAGDIV